MSIFKRYFDHLSEWLDVCKGTILSTVFIINMTSGDSATRSNRMILWYDSF